MSRKINVNPDHYKVAGRERQGEDIVHERQKQAMSKSREQVSGAGRSARAARRTTRSRQGRSR